MRVLLALVLMAAVLAGCASVPSPEQMAAADYGPEPTAEQFQAGVKAELAKSLFDPYSAQFSSWSPIQKGYLNHGFGRFTIGWYGTFYVNAKNRMGGYVGNTPGHAVFKHGVTEVVVGRSPR